MIVFPSVARGEINSPPSKSMAHRALICAMLSDCDVTISNIELSEDIKATLSCLDAFGKKYEISGDTVRIYKGFSDSPSKRFYCNESGSTLRFLMPLSLLDEKESRFYGTEKLLSRPLSVYERIFSENNIVLERHKGSLRLQGRIRPGVFEIDSTVSSQFITGLLFTLPLLEKASKIVLEGNTESRPYIDMTLDMIKRFGVITCMLDEKTILVPGNQHYHLESLCVEGDWSNAAFLDVFNHIGGDVHVKGLSEDSLQGDRIYRSYFSQISEGFCKIDITDCPDLGPVLFALAALKEGAHFTGTRRLRIKESDRCMSMREELSKFGVRCIVKENEFIVRKDRLHSPEKPLWGHNDHRIVMALTTLLSVTGGSIEGTDAVRKSYPTYFENMESLGIRTSRSI